PLVARPHAAPGRVLDAPSTTTPSKERESMNHRLVGRPLRSLVLLGVASATLVAAPALAANPDARATALMKLDEAWSASTASKDAAHVASYYAEDVVVYPPNEPMVNGREAAQKVWASYLGLPGFSISWKTLHAAVSKSGDLGFTTGTFE